MKAVVYHDYGPSHVLKLEEVEKPTPRDREVLIKVHATTVTIGDTIMRSLNIPGPFWQRLFARLYHLNDVDRDCRIRLRQGLAVPTPRRSPAPRSIRGRH